MSVVVPTHNRRELLADLVRALATDPVVAEIVVVDDASSDGTQAMIGELSARDPRIRLIRTAASGTFGCRHLGVLAAEREHVLLLDDDVIPLPGLASGHSRHHRKAGSPQVVLGHLLMSDSEPSATYALYRARHEAACRRYERDPSTVLTELWAGNMSLRRSDWLEVLPDPSDLPDGYNADRDFGLRCAAAGLRGVFDRSLAGEHCYARDLQRFAEDARASGASQASLRARYGAVTGGYRPSLRAVLSWFAQRPARVLLRRAPRSPLRVRQQLARVVWDAAFLRGAAGWSLKSQLRRRERMLLGLALPYLVLARATGARSGLVLVYHGVTDEQPSAAPPAGAIAARSLRRQLRLLRVLFRPADAEAVLALARARRRWQRFPVAITFDDDLASHATLAADALSATELRATFFVSGDPRRFAQAAWWLSRGEQILSEEALAQLAATSAIGFHTLGHHELVSLDDDALDGALREGRAELSDRVRQCVDAVAYPHGAANRRVAEHAVKAGFRFGFTTDGRAVRYDDEPLLLPRVTVTAGSMCQFALELARALRVAR